MLLTQRAIDSHERQVKARIYARLGRFDEFCKLIGYTPHSAQREVHDCPKARRVVKWGVRTGKTLLAAVEAAFEALKQNQRIWVVAPQHDLTERVWSALTGILCEDDQRPEYHGLGLRPSVRKEAPRKLAFPWGTLVEGHSTHSPVSRNAMAGASVNFAVWDECAKSPGSVWDLKLQPRLGDCAGRALLISTPEGYNHFFEWFQRGKPNADGQTKDPEWHSFEANCEVNMGNRPDLATAMAEARRTCSPEAFAQEWMGDFTQFAGRVYPEFDESKHVRHLSYDPDLPLALFFDFGATNPFVCLWAQFTASDEVRLLHEFTTAVIRDGRESIALNYTTMECGNAVLAEHETIPWRDASGEERYGLGEWDWAVADRSGKDEIATLRKHCGIRAVHRHITPGDQREREIPAGIRRVRRFIREDRLFVDPQCALTIYEFNRYSYPERPEDRNAQEIPHLANDHAMDALRYGVVYWLHRNPALDRRLETDETEDEVEFPTEVAQVLRASGPLIVEDERDTGRFRVRRR